ncbi:hypothetical protein, partial [Labrenzia sp. C1B10]|uniref:hypothetical protein n=1 Tax=Labrenzia sp. C1B10 TaxID=1397530 RepID=UPI00056A619B
SGLAEGTTLSAGVVNPDGSVTLSEADLLGLTVTALDPGTQLLNVDVTVTDPATGTSATTSELLSLEVLNVADVPLLDVSLTGPVLEDTATPLVIDLGVLNPGELAEVT